MNNRLTRRFILKNTENLKNLNFSIPIRYERYYINEKLRIQKKDNYYETNRVFYSIHYYKYS